MSADALVALAGALATHQGAIVQQVRGPALDGVVQLGLYLPTADKGERRILLDVWARNGRVGAWRTDERRPNRNPQSGFTMYLRKHLTGRRLARVRALPDGIALGWERTGAEQTWLIAWRGVPPPLPSGEPAKGGHRGGQLAHIDIQGRCRPAWPGRSNPDLVQRVLSASDSQAPEADVARDIEARARKRAVGVAQQQQAQGQGSELRRQVSAAVKKQRRLVGRLAKDLDQARQAERLREHGEVLKTQLAQVPSGADSVTLPVPWEPGKTVTIALKRQLSPAANLARIFRRARGFSRRTEEIELRWLQAQERLELLAALLPQCTTEAGEDVMQAAVTLGVVAAQPRQPARQSQRSTTLPAGVQRYRSPAGAEVLLGRSAAANDQLVTRLARGKDIWMHVRDRPGAHLLLRHNRKEPPAMAELLACAALVAWGSGIKREDRADVTWTQARHVRKAKGSAPGLVYVAQEHTLYVEVKPSVIEDFRQTRGR
ncbi:MAG: DUF814 domain-containing protein [Myxococcales bacterium]|nr:DUF814 domain-containing protein [Myxococcales bacterium]